MRVYFTDIAAAPCTVFVRISVTFSTLHSFISVKKFFAEHVYLTQHAHEP